MKCSLILIALRLLTASKETNESPEVEEPEQSLHNRLHNRLHIHGDRNWALNLLYSYNVMITWNIKAETMTLKTEREIGKARDKTLYYKCSGAIIAPAWVITAATCFQPKLRSMPRKKRETFIFPLPDGLVLSVKQNRSIDLVFAHHDFVETSRRGDIDIALVKLKNQFSTNKATDDYVSVAQLGHNLAYSRTLSENRMRNCKVASFGEDALTAEPPFTQKLSIYDVQAAGPKYCEVVHRLYMAPWYNQVHPMKDNISEENDMFDSYFICTTPHVWIDDGTRVPENEAGLGCFGMVGGSLTCDDQDVLVGVQSERFVTSDWYYCSDDAEAITTFTSVGHPKVYKWIKKHGPPELGPLVPLHRNDFPYEYRGKPIELPIRLAIEDTDTRANTDMPVGDDTTSASDTSPTSSMSTCGGIVLTLALTVIAFTFLQHCDYIPL